MTDTRRQRTPRPALQVLALALALSALPGLARDQPRASRALPIPASGVIGALRPEEHAPAVKTTINDHRP